jgi:hypothetical protein
VPEVFLFGVDAKRYPEVRSPVGTRNPPRELVVTFFILVESYSLVRELYRVAVVQLFGVVRLPKLRDVVAERGFGLVRQVVRNVSCRPSRYVSGRPLSFDCLCAVGGANVACNVFVTVVDTLLVL